MIFSKGKHKKFTKRSTQHFSHKREIFFNKFLSICQPNDKSQLKFDFKLFFLFCCCYLSFLLNIYWHRKKRREEDSMRWNFFVENFRNEIILFFLQFNPPFSHLTMRSLYTLISGYYEQKQVLITLAFDHFLKSFHFSFGCFFSVGVEAVRVREIRSIKNPTIIRWHKFKLLNSFRSKPPNYTWKFKS